MYIMPSTPLTCSSIGCRHRLEDRFGVRSGIERGHQDRGRGDLRVLRHREREHGHPAGQYENDRQHGGEDRAINAKVGNHGG